jgi:hypothetical protein
VDEVVYDSCGRMKYHPEFHDKQGTKWSKEDLEYLCKFAEVDDLETLGMALGRPITAIYEQLSKLKKNGKYEHYRKLNRYW